LSGCAKNRKAQRTVPCACTFVDPSISKKVIINQIARFFSTKYRVLSNNNKIRTISIFFNGGSMTNSFPKLTATVKAAG